MQCKVEGEGMEKAQWDKWIGGYLVVSHLDSEPVAELLPAALVTGAAHTPHEGEYEPGLDQFRQLFNHILRDWLVTLSIN